MIKARATTRGEQAEGCSGVPVGRVEARLLELHPCDCTPEVAHGGLSRAHDHRNRQRHTSEKGHGRVLSAW